MPHLDSERITTRFLLGSLLLLPTVALGQDAPSQIVLSEPDRAADHGFTHVIGIFELRDGSVVVADNYDAAVYLVDRSWETTVQLGRTGAGPREYQHPAALFPLGGDSTAIKDPENDRLLIVRADGTLGGVLNRVLPSSSSSASPRQQWVEASDGAGHFFAQAQPVARDERGQLVVADSAAIERWAVGSTKRDTVAFVLNFFGGSSVVGGSVIGPGGPVNPFPSSVQWAVAQGGRVAIVYPDPYHVVFVEPNGARREGPVIAVDPIRVSEEHKARWLADWNRPQLVWFARRGESASQVVMKPPPPPEHDWPDHLPPFLRDALRFGPGGLLWVQRTTPAEDPPTFDVIGESGSVLARVQLAKGARLVGFGRESVYLVRRDEMDLEYLERYTLAEIEAR